MKVVMRNVLQTLNATKNHVLRSELVTSHLREGEEQWYIFMADPSRVYISKEEIETIITVLSVTEHQMSQVVVKKQIFTPLESVNDKDRLFMPSSYTLI